MSGSEKKPTEVPRVMVTGPTIGVNLRVTGNCNQGGRKYMEDMFSVAYQQTANCLDLEYAFFGMFDGHGGHHAASFAKEHLMKNIIMQADFWEEDDNRIVQAIEDGFIETHHGMWNNLEKWPKTVSGLPSTSGTTASIAFLRHSKAYIGHVGDSGIVIGRQKNPSTTSRLGPWVAENLTVDHKPENQKELDRIKIAGGQVVSKSGVPRVVWQRPNPAHIGPQTRSTPIDSIPFLAVARSLGDLWSFNSDTEEFIVSPFPDVIIHQFDLTKDRCLILGTDGLFNMLTAQDAVDIVERAEKNNQEAYAGKGGAWMNPAKFLVDHAIAKWSNSRLRADNTSALVLLLDPMGEPLLSSATATKKTLINGTPINERCNSPNQVYIHTWPPKNQPAGVSSSDPIDRKIDYDKKPMLDTNGLYTSASERWKKKALRRVRKRRNSETGVKVVKRNRSVCSDSCPDEDLKRTLRPRRTRSEEPTRADVRKIRISRHEITEGEAKVARSESDAENIDAPMRLRSATPFKTLRSRNIIHTKVYHSLYPSEEPRAKRIKK